MNPKQFWKFQNEVSSDETKLVLDGVIANESWWGDEVTPQLFRDELKQHKGELTVVLNSPGGDVFAGVSIYNALREYDGNVTVRVDGIAASIASIIAMAGDKIIMSPGSMMMIHKPWTLAMGDSEELQKTIEVLNGIEESLVPIYAKRTGLSEEVIGSMLEAETWMTAEEAVAQGFADELIEAKEKVSYSDAIKNMLNGNPAFSMEATKESLKNLAAKIEEAEADEAKAEPETVEEVQDVPEPETTETTDEVVEETTVEAEAETTDEQEVTEPVTEEIKNAVDKETKMSTTQDTIAQDAIVNAAPTQAPSAAPSNYLKSKASVEDFANVLKAQAGKSAEDVKAAWKDVLVKNGLTDADYFRLPEPLVSNIEDAVNTSGIYNLLDHTGLDVFKAVWDDTDSEVDTSRAGGHTKGDTKAEQLLDFNSRVIRAQYIYKYLVLDKETIRENRSTGALVRFVLNELPTRIIREVERAVVIGDGRLEADARKISSFTSIKSDVVANNSFGTTYTPAADESRYVSLTNALDLLESEGPVYLISKKGFTTGLKLETTANGGYVFAPGTDVAAAMGFAGEFKPTWFTEAADAEYDAYLVVLNQYKTVGDNSIEAFTNFKLATNENEFLQEIYKGGALTSVKAAVGIAKPAVA